MVVDVINVLRMEVNIVGEIVSVVSGLLLVVTKWVFEGWEKRESWCIGLGPVPLVVDGPGEATDDRKALIGDAAGEGVLVAQHDEGLSVDTELAVKLSVADLEIVDAVVELVEFSSVRDDLLSVVLDVGVVLVDVTVVVVDVDVGVSDAILKGGDRFTDSLSADKHVAGLGNLELISVLTEEGAVGIEGSDGLLKVGDLGVGGRRGLISTVMKMAGVRVVVMGVELVVVL